MAALTAEIGEEEEKTLIEILQPSDGRIDTSKLVDHVRDPAAGAIATFEGTTRDTFDGKRVVELRYEAYVPMAVRQLRSIVSAARSRWSLHRAAVAHRLGTVPVGDASVFVAVSSVHRADALEACRYVIDEVKASVPIWKKEVYEGGEVWKENPEFLSRRATIMGSDEGSRCCGRKVRVCDETDIDGSHSLGLKNTKEVARKAEKILVDNYT